MNIIFEVLNMIIAQRATTKVWNEYHYIRSILTLYPDGTSNQIQRRLVCHGVRNAALNNLRVFTIMKKLMKYHVMKIYNAYGNQHEWL